MCVLRALLAALLLGTWLPCQTAAQTPAQELQERARQVLEAAGCETELPGDGAGSGPEEQKRQPQKGTRVLPREPAERPLRASLPCFGSQLLLWLAVAVAVIGLLVMIVRGVRRSGEGPMKAATVKGTATPGTAAVIAELPDHARLAQQGQFAAAVHALLRHAFAALARRGNALPEHATGRALLARATGSLPTEGLSRLVQSVELLHFGGRPAQAEHYQESLRSYQQWEAACSKQR